MTAVPQWLQWSRRLQAIAQTGLTYAKDPFDQERYESIREIAAEIMAYGAGGSDIQPIAELFKSDSGYATPKIDVRAAVFDTNGHVLLVREREDGRWTLPGGWADIGSSPGANVTREVLEESGYETEIVKLAAVYDRDLHGHPHIPFYTYKIFFISKLVGGAPTDSIETDCAAFFPVDQLPELSLTRVTGEQIRHMFDHYRNPDWPTSFD